MELKSASRLNAVPRLKMVPQTNQLKTYIRRWFCSPNSWTYCIILFGARGSN